MATKFILGRTGASVMASASAASLLPLTNGFTYWGAISYTSIARKVSKLVFDPLTKLGQGVVRRKIVWRLWKPWSVIGFYTPL